ncbi:hypothetical protein [Nocardia sp. NPDC056100]|uniref:hypothetical protein n=1 Tax=Nocardia sp. NPDC056100 TaxID=3345712 RepID=UPI0035D53281
MLDREPEPLNGMAPLPFALDLPPVERTLPPPEPLSAARVSEVRPTGLSALAEAIVTRWNPHGMALLLAMRSCAQVSHAAVALIVDDDVHIPLLRAELAGHTPRVELLTADVESHEPRRPAAVACVVLDAGALIGREMLGTVRRLRGAGTRIVFALAGFHAHPEWREVRERAIELLSEGEPVEIVPISARMAVVARMNGDAGLGDRSGIGELHARLVAAVGAGAVRDQAGIVRERVVAETRTRIEGELAKLRTGGDVAALRAERATLLAVNDGGRGTAMAMIRNRLHLARVDLLHEAGVRIRGLNAAARAEIERLPRGAHAGYPQRLQDSVEKITRDIDRDTHGRLAELDRLLAEAVRAPDSVPPDLPAGSALGWRDRRPRVGPDPEPRCRGVEDHLMIALGGSAGFGAGRLAVVPLAWWEAAEYAIVPVGLVLGVAAAGWVVRARRQLAERAHLRQWVADALVNVKAQLEQRVATALVEAEERLTERVLWTSTARMVETDRRVGELEAHLRQAAQRRPALLTACERDLSALDFA